jgi:hypothetical protein
MYQQNYDTISLKTLYSAHLGEHTDLAFGVPKFVHSLFYCHSYYPYLVLLPFSPASCSRSASGRAGEKREHTLSTVSWNECRWHASSPTMHTIVLWSEPGSITHPGRGTGDLRRAAIFRECNSEALMSADKAVLVSIHHVWRAVP